jgi:transcriptional regulator with XRE-family HTH domain
MRARRLLGNITLEGLAHRAGLSKTTLSSMENGADFRISSMLRVLRVLGALDSADAFLANPAASPLQIVERLSRKPRQRASSSQRSATRPVTRAAPAVRTAFVAEESAPTFPDTSGVARVGVPPAARPRTRPARRRKRG